MDLIYAGIIVFLCGFIVFKEIMWHRHLDKLEEKLLSRDLTDYKINTTPIAPEDKENKIAEEDRTIDLENVPNPYIKNSMKV